MAKLYFFGDDMYVESKSTVNQKAHLCAKTTMRAQLHSSLLFLLACFLSFPAFSQITIGTSTTTQIYPLGNVLGYERSASIYLASEASTGTISKLAWYANSSGVARPISIYLKTTSANTFSSSTWDAQTSGATLVYSGVVAPVVGWNTILLSTPFSYETAVGNLVVLVEANSGGAGLGPTSSASVRHSPAAFRHMFFRGNNAPPLTAGTINGARPNIQISFASAAVPPNCAINLQPANASASVPLNTTLSWNAGDGQPESYDVYFGTSSNPTLVGNQAGTSFSPALLQPFTQYFWKVVPKNASGAAISCSVQSFTTSDQFQYCNSAPINNDNLGITNVTLAQTSFVNPDVTYNNFTTPVNVGQGTATNLQITFATGVSYDTNVWIDLNKDGEFSNSTELVFQGASTPISPTTLDATFYLPAGVALGDYKMRIGTADTGQATPNPCYSGPYGVTIDMVLNVTAEVPMPPTCPLSISPAQSATNVALNPTLSWSPASGSVLSYDIYFGTSSNPALVMNVPAATTSFTPAAPLSPSAIYYWKVVAKNTHGSSTGCVTQMFLTGTEMQYCTPTYNNACSAGDVIQSFTLNSLSNTSSGCNGNVNNYIKYPASGSTTTSLGQGVSYNASIKAGSNSANIGIYIDLNKNGIFDANEYFGTNSLVAAHSTRNIAIAIPQSTAVGAYRLRVRSISSFTFANVDACASASNGETEDYIINIVECNATVWFADLDNDGYGNSNSTITSCEQPEGYVSVGGDCDDNNPNIYRSGSFYIDNDGDGFDAGMTIICYGQNIPQGYSSTTLGADCDDSLILYADIDGDGYGSTQIAGCGVTNTTDCDDTNPLIYQTQTVYVDADGDGFHSAVESICIGSTIPEGYSLTTLGEDCDDSQFLYADNDGDGFGSGEPVSCGVNNNSDCDDNNPSVYQTQTLYVDADGDGFHSGTAEVCYGSTVPEGYSLTTLGEDCDDTQLLYADNDGDGFGAGEPVGCGVANNTDCDDNNPLIYQNQTVYIDADGDGFHGGTTSICYGSTVPQGYSLTTLGEDCDDSQFLYADNDGDGFGSGEPVSCGVNNNSDCDDNNPSVYQTQTLYVDADGDGFHSGTAEVCYGSTVPEGYSLTTLGEDCDDTQLLYADNDGDGFGAGEPVGCGVANNTDCDDTDATKNQSVLLYVDADNDGYHSTTVVLCIGEAIPVGYSLTTLGLDCNDQNATVYRSESVYIDNDGDGFDGGMTEICFGITPPAGYMLETLGADCNDQDASVFHGAFLFADNDGDGYHSGSTFFCYGNIVPQGYIETSLGLDCNDNDAAINPGATEILYNGIDENCDGVLDEGFQRKTSVKENQCGITLPAISTSVQIYVDGLASAYKYRITNLSTNQVEYLISTKAWFNFTELQSYAYGNSYSVDVEIQIQNTWVGYYGAACTISLPALSGAFAPTIKNCGSTLVNLSSTISCGVISAVQGYKFKVTNLSDPGSEFEVQEIERAESFFNLSMLEVYNYGKTYSIQAAIKTGGAYSEYGPACTISSPALNLAFLSIKQCGTIYDLRSKVINAFSIAHVKMYRFRVTNMTTSQSQIIDSVNPWILFTQLTYYNHNTNFSVEVAVKVTGDFSDYGAACIITTSAAAKAASGLSLAEMVVKGSPNPFVDTFTLSFSETVSQPVQVNVYDMLGKLIESREIQPTTDFIQLGERYPSGVYSVLITQSDQVKSIKMIKR